ncbi:type II toxin-antitoxin system Phd/YefM family antitoxin [Larkinella sp. VNQ87]|uniref:type II toxin-antitoxin system Phd/YefM family antitoxin n=1 Tax=Larkinella sp. VNQ87 TaxID=3400921 RepID=UPI003C0A4218
MKILSTAEARNQFADLVNQAAFGKEPVVLTRRGKKVAAIISIEDLELLERLEDERDVREAEKVLAANEPTISLNDLKKELGL